MKKRIIFLFVLIVSLFLVSCEDTKKDLGAPKVTLTGDVVSWNSIKEAKHYLLYIDEEEVKVTTTSFNLVDENLEEGTYTIYVVAVKDEVISKPSNKVKYTVTVAERRLDAPVVTLTGDVVSWNSISGAESYIIKVNGQEITVTGTSFDLSTKELEPGTYDIKVVAVKGSNISLDSLIVKYVVLSKEDVNLMTRALLKKFDQDYDLGLTEEDFLHPLDYNDYLDALNTVNIFVDAFLEINYSKEDAINLFNNLYDFFNEDVEALDLNKVLELIDILVINNLTAEVATKFLLKIISSPNLELIEEVQLLLDDYELLINDALEIIFNFVFELRANVPEDLVELLNLLINNEETDLPLLSTIIRIKNETVLALENTLLTAEEFETLYQLIFVIKAVMTDEEMVNIDSELQYLSLLTHQTLKVGLLLIKDFTEDDYETVSTLMASLMVDIDNEEEPVNNVQQIEVMLELLAFINGYVERFTLNNEEEVLALEALLDKELIKPLYEMFVDIIIDMAYPLYNYEEEEINLNTYLKASLKNEYYSIFKMMELSKTLEKDFLEAIIESNGSIINVILNINSIKENPKETINQIVSLLKELDVYNDALINALTKDALEDLLKVLIIPLMIESEFYLLDNAVEIETGLREIIPNMSQLIFNLLIVEKDIFKAIKAFDIDNYINEAYGYVEPNTLGISVGIIHLLDEVLTTGNKPLIDESLDLIFDSILTNETLQYLLGFSNEETEQMKLEVLDLKDYLYSEISTLASYDHTALNIEEEKAIITFLNSLGIAFNLETQYETYEKAMARAIPLELGIPQEEMYRTSYLIFSFTPDEDGYYELHTPYVGSEFEVRIKDSSFFYYDYFYVYDYEQNNINDLFLEKEQTYYIVLDYMFNTSYEYVEIEISKKTYENLVLDTPSVFSSGDERVIFEFHSLEDNLYTLNLISSESYEGYLGIKDMNHNYLFEDYHYVTNGSDKSYTFYLKSGESIYLYLTRGSYTYVDLNVLVVVADSLEVITDEVITLNEPFEEKMIYFVAPESGFYDLEFESLTYSRFYLESVKQFNNNYIGGYTLEDGEVKIINVYLEARTPLILIIDVDVESYTLNMTIRKIDESSLNVLEVGENANKTVTLSDGIDFKVNVDQPGFYNLNFKASNMNRLEFVLYNNKGDIIEQNYHYFQEEDELYSFEVFLSLGEYYLDLTISPIEEVLTLDVLIGLELIPPKSLSLGVPEEIVFILEEYLKTEMFLFVPLEDGNYKINVELENADSWNLRVVKAEYVSFMDESTWGYGNGIAKYFLEENAIYCVFVTVYSDNVLNLTINLDD